MSLKHVGMANLIGPLPLILPLSSAHVPESSTSICDTVTLSCQDYNKLLNNTTTIFTANRVASVVIAPIAVSVNFTNTAKVATDKASTSSKPLNPTEEDYW